MSSEPPGFKTTREHVNLAYGTLGDALAAMQADPRFGAMAANVLQQAQQPLQLTPELIQSMKDQANIDVNNQLDQALNEIGARFGQSSGVRSGPAQAAMGSAASEAIGKKDQTSRMIDTQVVPTQNRADLAASQQAVQAFFQLLNQLPMQQAANLTGSLGPLASAASQPSPLQQAMGGVGQLGLGALGLALGPAAPVFNMLGSGAGAGAGGSGGIGGLFGGGGPFSGSGIGGMNFSGITG